MTECQSVRFWDGRRCPGSSPKHLEPHRPRLIIVDRPLPQVLLVLRAEDDNFAHWPRQRLVELSQQLRAKGVEGS
jgi:hypothetical protein